MATASQLTRTLQDAAAGLRNCGAPIGLSPYGASGDLQCVFDGKFVRLLSFAPPAAAPTTVHKLWDRTVVFGPTWIVIAADLAQAQTIQRVIGGRLYLTPVLTLPPSVALSGPKRSCPIGCVVRFRVGVQNPMDRSALLSCHARGLSNRDAVLFREPGTVADGLRRSLGPRAIAHLTGIAHLERAATVARVIAWCTARSLTQPQ